ncbi:hypothetical protein EPO15_07765 [bacterium]|nr:MAG: hypothetical protein EPO15_07765 [bacterium]
MKGLPALLLLAASPAAADPAPAVPEPAALVQQLKDGADADLPEELRHDARGAPVPAWDQLVRGDRAAHLRRILGGSDAEAKARFGSWSPEVRRAFGLFLDKFDNEGWLGVVGPLLQDPWQDTVVFKPVEGPYGGLAKVLSDKPGQYTENSLGNGAAAYLTAWNHKNWTRGWMENDVPNACLHVGLTDAGAAEAHFEAYNPLFTNGAAKADVVWAPLFGSLNARLMAQHKRWEDPPNNARSRTSANFYHLMKGRVPLSF